MFIADGKGGHQRLVPVVPGFFVLLAAYLANERPAHAGGSTNDHVFVVLKGPNRGLPLTAAGSTRSWQAPGPVPAYRMRRATNCGTPASPGYAKPEWHSR